VSTAPPAPSADPTQGFHTSFEPGQPGPVEGSSADASGVTHSASDPTPGLRIEVTGGPDAGYSVKRGVGLTGRHSLGYTGHDAGRGRDADRSSPEDGDGPSRPDAADVHAHHRILAADVTVGPDTQLRYAIFPRDVSDSRTLPVAGASVALDLAFSDGTFLRDLDPRDEHGLRHGARAYGQHHVLFAGHWNAVVVEVGKVAAGKRITGVLLDYERPSEEPPADPSIAGWIDDVEIGGPRDAIEPDGGPGHLADLVDIRRGTNSNAAYSRGNTLPAVTVPHGFNFWIPMTDASSGRWPYHYQQQNTADNLPALQAFSLSHQQYPWGGDHHTLQVMPIATPGHPNPDRIERAQSFRHQDEIARPYLYAVTFTSGLRAELTPTDHGAMFRFTYPGDVGQVMIDNLTGDEGGASWDPSADRLTGVLGSGTDTMFVVGRFDQDVVEHGGLQTARPTTYCRFDTSSDHCVVLRIATSRISLDQAAHNLELELDPSLDFETVRDRARDAWDALLGVVSDVQGASHDQLVTLYSSLYRMHQYQNSNVENVGSAAEPDLRHASALLPPRQDNGADGPGTGQTPARVVPGRQYRSSGFWDTYRTTWPALGLLNPDLAGELMDGVVSQFTEAGWFPTGMVGSCVDASIAELHVQGVPSTDVDAAYDVLLKHATVVSNRPGCGRPGLARAIFLGYTPMHTDNAADSDESLADALENYLGDFAIAAVAGSLFASTGAQHYADEQRYFLNRARNYVHMFDPGTGFFQGRRADGTWRLPPDRYDPCEWGYDYTETDGWGMAFAVPQDPQGLANLYGGRDGLVAKLDEFFATREGADRFGSYGATIHEIREAAGIQQGQWGLSNQPGFHIPFMYEAVGRPDRTAEVVRHALARQFAGSVIGQGYPGDEDTGSMSVWFLLSALGLYPLQPGSGRWLLTSPLFSSATITRPDGTRITVRAPQGGIEHPDNIYVQGVRVNGEVWEKTWIDHETLTSGVDVEFELGPEPSDWGTSPEAAIPSLTEGEQVGRPLGDLTEHGTGRPTVPRDARVVTLAASAGGADGASAQQATGDGSGVPDAGAYVGHGQVGDALFDDTSATGLMLSEDAGRDIQVFWSFGVHHEGTAQLYTLTSAMAGQAPTSWELHGSDDAREWTLLDARQDETFRWDRQTRPFSIAEPGKYRHYRWTLRRDGQVTGAGTPESDRIALAQLELLG
jgi:predicted alpha-1,2-mannosidase